MVLLSPGDWACFPMGVPLEWNIHDLQRPVAVRRPHYLRCWMKEKPGAAGDLIAVVEIVIAGNVFPRRSRF